MAVYSYEQLRLKIHSICVMFLIGDTTPPTISGCPGTQTAVLSSGASSIAVSWTEPTASDNSGVVNLVGNYAPGSSFPLGTTTVTYTATDGSGNQASCSFQVVVSQEATGNGMKSKTLNQFMG